MRIPAPKRRRRAARVFALAFERVFGEPSPSVELVAKLCMSLRTGLFVM